MGILTAPSCRNAGTKQDEVSCEIAVPLSADFKITGEAHPHPHNSPAATVREYGGQLTTTIFLTY